jgi:hypothetical protein
VATALDDEPQFVLTREIDSRNDVRHALGGDFIRARCRRPGVRPAGALRRAGLVADVKRIAQILQRLAAGCRISGVVASGERRSHLD